ncbi:MAG: ATP-binding protein [Anaerolineae bacterium]|nr:ATP-binding protein [Anaerolineae bacterium]MDK1082180.1 ATP-binding protein [Anaerolineae bacterium]MDK1118978.1 ATP-binding protein [Anaerolineae bacterium]
MNTFFRYILGVILTIGFSLSIFYWVMSPPMGELQLMALFLAITALISSLAGYLAYRLGWIALTPSIRWGLLAIYAISSILTFFNVWFSARLMFASEHDLLLASVLLVFAGGMAMALGHFLSSTMTERLDLLKQGAKALAQGDLKTRVKVFGRDEIATLGSSFNQMAAQLQTADQKQRELENLRRDLIAWISHDLQTPLASMRAVLEALSDGVVQDPETVNRYLSIAQRDVRSLSVLIDDLFQMAQLDAGGIPLDKADSSLSDLISDTLESFSELASRQNISLEGSADPKVDPVIMDTQRIGRVLNNLIGNALRYTPKGGMVEVRAQRAGSSVEVSVRDSGDGIRPEDIPNIFQSFYRGEKSRSRSTGGAGLGLAIARGIVRAHGGEIRVESKPGNTCFIFSLP